MNTSTGSISCSKCASSVTRLATATSNVRLADDPTELEREIIRLNADGIGARMMAGFCWSWSDPGGAH